MNDIATDEIAEYVAQVRAALPEGSREELLDDLPEHLAEVLAEGNGSLVERLGSPSTYAAELLAAAGLTSTPPERPDPLIELRDRFVEWARVADVRVGPLLGYERAGEFLVLLRPAWWVLRGYLFAMVLAHLLDTGPDRVGLLPRVGGSLVVAILLLGASIVGSIWLGRRGTPEKPWPRYTFYAGTALLIVLSIIGFGAADIDSRTPAYVDATYSGSSGYENVQDVFVYDDQGRLVEDAHLYDQAGNPIQLGSQYCSNQVSGESWTSWHRGYPRCPEGNPFRSPSPTDSALPTDSPSPFPSPSAESSLPASAPVPSLSPSR